MKIRAVRLNGVLYPIQGEDAQAAAEAAAAAATKIAASYGTRLLAEDYSTETGGTEGSYYIHSGGLYLCVEDTAGEWDGSKFQEVKLGKEMSNLKSAIQNMYISDETLIFERREETIYDGGDSTGA